jgi:methylated-DNA-[protein]-cysteine S-methyltransferase
MQAQEGSTRSREGTAPPLRVLMPSPIGPLGVELTGSAVTRLRIDPQEPERALYAPLHGLDGSDFLDEVFGRLSEYFAGARRKLDLEYDLAPCGLSGHERRVLREAAKVPYGKTRTCHALAEAMGAPAAGRQVLSVLLGNPIPILIPCHRVVEDRQVLGSYVGGGDRKRWLLDLESQEGERAEG